ncbi:MAG: hypothetical protein ACOYKR_08340 [Sphingobacterium thalpophilum]
MKQAQYEVLFLGDNVWTVDGKPWVFNSWEEAEAELELTFEDMAQEDIDFEPTDYRIEEIVK